MQAQTKYRFDAAPRAVFQLLIAIILLAPLSLPVLAQSGAIKGKITDRQTGDGLPGVEVKLAGTALQAVTNEKGEFAFLNVPVGSRTLRLTYLGYASARVDSIPVNSSATTDVILETSAHQQMLKSIVVYPKSEKQALANFFDKMKWGNLVFTVPDSMELYETKGIHMLLSLTKSAKELQQLMNATDVLRERKIRVSKVMAARLKGEGFRVEPLTEALQAVDVQGETQWKWEVTALQPGVQKLHLTIDAIVNIDGRDMPHTVQSLSEEIQIHVSWPQQLSRFVAENWQWLWTAVAVPVIGWYWERRKKSPSRRIRQ